ncbi:MAG: archaeal preflagellin peptidase FlaK [Thermoproteota archaeon]|nr:archaeal preflagellin peptidase FlaK [Thermoproteota archaeon]
MNIIDFVEIAKIIACLFFLSFSSIQDYKERRVSNVVFVILLPIAAILSGIDIFLASNPLGQLINFAIYTSISIAIFYVIYFVGLFGGADAKMFIALTIAMPWPPKIVAPLLGQSFPFFSISILNNSLLSSVSILPYAFLSNLGWKMRTRSQLFEGVEKESAIKKIGSLIFCIKKEKVKIKPYDMVAEENGRIILFK